MVHVLLSRLPRCSAAALALAVALGACTTAPSQPASPASGQTAAPAGVPGYRYVLLGEQGSAVARVITASSTCPELDIDGVKQPMTLRAAAETIALRPTALSVAESMPAAFPLITCEATIAAGSRSASVQGQPLALPKPALSRIVVLGDTGCRLQSPSKTAGGAFQNCNNPNDYPFAQIARVAAAWQPDLVLHVGDYHYRESPCPASQPGCAGSPHGYGWDAWRADFFEPGRALLEVAPWVMVRGNHESCVRGGQGFWRFLDPRPLLPNRNCNQPHNDQTGDFSDPYAVPLGDRAQLLVMDTAATGNHAFVRGDLRIERYQDLYAKVEQLSTQAEFNIATMHHPLLAFVALPTPEGEVLKGGNGGLIGVWNSPGKSLLPARIHSVLSGHVHMWQQVSFASQHPTQFVSGFSGTQEETVPLPSPLPPNAEPAPGAVVDTISSWFDGFGYMTMERLAPDQWEVKVWDSKGQPKNTCKIKGSKSQCELGAIAPPR